MVQGLGSRLQQLRKSKNLSQKTVADALGIAPSLLSNYESSARTPSLEQLISLASFYRCSTDYLLGFEKYNPSSVIDTSMLNEKQHDLLNLFLSSLTDN